jgi:hypothetical protein
VQAGGIRLYTTSNNLIGPPKTAVGTLVLSADVDLATSPVIMGDLTTFYAYIGEQTTHPGVNEIELHVHGAVYNPETLETVSLPRFDPPPGVSVFSWGTLITAIDVDGRRIAVDYAPLSEDGTMPDTTVYTGGVTQLNYLSYGRISKQSFAEQITLPQI